MRERSRQIVGELAELERQRAQESRKRDQAEAILRRNRVEITALSDRLGSARAGHDATAKGPRLCSAKRFVRPDCPLQEAVFAERECFFEDQ